MKRYIRPYLFPLLIIFFIVTVTFSCKKAGPCKATVTVVDSLERAVAGALVVLRQDSVVNPNTGAQADVYQEATTNSSGDAFFEFDKEAVLNIEASKGDMYGRDYIRLEQSGTVTRTVKIKK
jgi:hypothetical protein